MLAAGAGVVTVEVETGNHVAHVLLGGTRSKRSQRVQQLVHLHRQRDNTRRLVCQARNTTRTPLHKAFIPTDAYRHGFVVGTRFGKNYGSILAPKQTCTCQQQQQQ